MVCSLKTCPAVPCHRADAMDVWRYTNTLLYLIFTERQVGTITIVPIRIAVFYDFKVQK